jgi:hypothetical protein
MLQSHTLTGQWKPDTPTALQSDLVLCPQAKAPELLPHTSRVRAESPVKKLSSFWFLSSHVAPLKLESTEPLQNHVMLIHII